MGTHVPATVRPFLSLWGEVSETPMHTLPEIAKAVDVGAVFIKDEGLRLNAGSFKSLGGAYAVMVLVKGLLEKHLGEEVRVAQLLSPTAREFAKTVTVCCATDGNHGRSVAAGARLLGCRSVIFVHAGVSEARARAIGADEIVQIEGSYDDSVDASKRVSKENGWLLVSDTSWPGYERVPSLVAQGYTVLAEEALRQISELGSEPPTHVFLQAGVGGFASSIAGFLSEALAPQKIVTAIVEPDRAACLYESAKVKKLVSTTPSEPTIMAMLECYRPSLIAWRILSKVAAGFIAVTEENAREAMRRLAFREGHGQSIVAGESGAAGLAGLMAVATDPDARRVFGMDAKSRVLLINTETATDPGSYRDIVGRLPQDIG
ncbi:diaminopropionate ammonia-lyase [Arvimicrobium flavum]|uniref:diaminopropionate ammonia-lyase n=1 Tax=Arvimicrobium flavum TaxID=3393320 RepID=UPI00237A7411|nr:diaminopropionate ammonia-lyase [Mesorhizobium shangrilense]